MWLSKRPAVLADEQGLGKTASCIAYIASLLAEFKVTAPVLVVVPLSMLGFWEGEPVQASIAGLCCMIAVECSTELQDQLHMLCCCSG
jgi:hypothetical protein